MENKDDLCGGLEFNSTGDIEVPTKLIDQVIGQEHAVEVIKKAATQRRHVMMIGTPGTGKSMLAKAMAELLPKEELQDVLIYHNPEDGNNPKVRVVPAGKGKQIVNAHKLEAQKNSQLRNLIIVFAMLGILVFAWVYMNATVHVGHHRSTIITAPVTLRHSEGNRNHAEAAGE